MAIEKIKRTKSHKREAAKPVPSSPNLEQTRKQFQRAVLSGPPHLSTEPAQKPDEPAVPAHHSNRKRTLIIAIAAFLVVLVTSVSAYAFFWYQSPDKIVMDAILNTAAAPNSTYSGKVYERNDKQPTLTYNGAFSNGLSHIRAKVATPFTGDLATVNTEAIIGQDKLFIKIDKTSQLIESSVAQNLRAIVGAMIPEIKAKTDNKWVELSPSDLASFKTFTIISQCSVDIIERITTDATFRADLAGLYGRSPFLRVVDSGPVDSRVNKYTLSLDVKKFDSFMDILTRSQLYASLAGCHIDTNVIKGENLKDLKLVLEINKAQRQITHAEFNTGSYFASRITLDPVFDVPVTVALPTDATNFNDIKAQAFRQYIITNLGF